MSICQFSDIFATLCPRFGAKNTARENIYIAGEGSELGEGGGALEREK
jgi:hypothetical protein